MELARAQFRDRVQKLCRQQNYFLRYPKQQSKHPCSSEPGIREIRYLALCPAAWEQAIMPDMSMELANSMAERLQTSLSVSAVRNGDSEGTSIPASPALVRSRFVALSA